MDKRTIDRVVHEIEIMESIASGDHDNSNIKEHKDECIGQIAALRTLRKEILTWETEDGAD